MIDGGDYGKGPRKTLEFNCRMGDPGDGSRSWREA